MGFCHFDQEEDGSSSMRIAIEGFGKPNKMKKNSKKLAKKLGLNIKEIIKGQYTDEIVQEIGQEHLTKEESIRREQLGEQATQTKQEDDLVNDGQTLQEVAKAFVKANKDMTTNVVTLLKAAQKDNVVYTKQHIAMAETAFRAAASLVDKYQEQVDEGIDLAKTAPKISTLKENIVKNDLAKKYETIWKKVQREYDKQMEGLSAPFKEKMNQFKQLLEDIKAEALVTK
jgi:hypothetical protein